MTKYDELMSDPEFRKMLAVETLVVTASDVIARLMSAQNLSKADVARRLGKSRPWVTQLLNGKANVTVRTLAEVAFELGGEVKLDVMTRQDVAVGTSAQWKRMTSSGRSHVYRPIVDRSPFRISGDSSPQVPNEVEDYAA